MQSIVEVFISRGERAQDRNCQDLKVFLDHLVQDEHLKEYVDLEKTQEEEVEIRPNPKFDDTLEKDLLETIHMIGDHTTPISRIRSGKSASSAKCTRFYLSSQLSPTC